MSELDTIIAEMDDELLHSRYAVEVSVPTFRSWRNRIADLRPSSVEAADESVIRKVVDGVMDQREEILRAFVARHGFQPDEAIQVCGSDGSWRVIRRDDMLLSSAEAAPKAEGMASYEEVAEFLFSIGWRGNNGDGQWHNLRDNLPKLAAMLSTPAAAPAPVDGMVLDRPARVAGRDFAAGEPVQRVIGRAHAHYDVQHAAPTSAPTPDRATPGERDALQAHAERFRAEVLPGIVDQQQRKAEGAARLLTGIPPCENCALLQTALDSQIDITNTERGLAESCARTIGELRAELAALTQPIASSEAAHADGFDAWWLKNVPAGTVIGNPQWWIPRIRAAIAHQTAAAPGAVDAMVERAEAAGEPLDLPWIAAALGWIERDDGFSRVTRRQAAGQRAALTAALATKPDGPNRRGAE